MSIVESSQSRCLVAVARCDITPPVGIYHRMWGAATHDRSTGVHRPLLATVFFLRQLDGDHENQQIAVALDHCLFWNMEMNSLLDVVSTSTGVRRDQLTIFFSHTHGAGLMGLERRHLPGGDLISPYLDELTIKISGLIEDAQRRLEPSTIVYGRGWSDLATNRDYYDEHRKGYVCGFNPAGKADDTVIVARITSEAHRTLGTLVNYACHPTTLAWENTLISPDYIGAMREVIETATAAPCFFIQGASGDIGPQEGFVGDVGIADRNGRRLGYAALAALEAMPQPTESYEYVGAVVSGATLGIWKARPETQVEIARHGVWKSQRIVVSLAYRNDLPNRTDLEQELAHWRSVEEAALARSNEAESRDARAMIERATRRLIRVASLPPGATYPYPIIAWRIGSSVWLAFDGEHYNVLQVTLRERFPVVSLIIGTIANGSNVWYLPDMDSYGNGLYSEEVSVLKKGSLELVIEAATELIRNLISA